MAQQEVPEVGTVVDGYMFMGGSPSDQSSWRAVSRAATYANGRARGLTPKEQGELAAAREAARNALGVLPDLERFSRLNADQDSGGLYAVPFVDQVLGAIDPEASQMNEITSRLAPAQRQEGSGTMSDRDLALFLRSVPSVQRPREANSALIERGRAEGRRRQAYADFLDRYAAEQGTLSGADELFRAQVAAGQIDLSGYGGPANAAAAQDELRVRDLLPNETPEALAASGRVRGADGVWRYPRDEQGNPIFPDDAGDGSSGVNGSARPGSGGEAAPAIGSGEGSAVGMEQVLGGQAAFARSALEQVPFGDELMAGFAGVMSGQGYDRMRQAQQALANYDRENNGFERNMGGVAGAVAQIPVGMGVGGAVPQILRQAPRVAGASRAANTGRVLANTARNAGGGIATGAVYGAGAGEGGLAERGGNALEGAAIGGVLGPVAGVVGERAISPAISGIGRMIRPNALEDAAGTYASRFRPDTNALAARATELENLGTQPAFIDLVDDARLGTFRAINTRDTPAREAGTRLAETRRRNLPSRVRQIAGDEISGETRPTLEVIDELSATRRNNAQEGMADFGGQQVRLNENAVQAVRSDMARSAIRDAAVRAQASLDPVERASAGRLNQLADMALDNPSGAAMTVREAQDVSAALNAAADGAYRSNTPANGPVLSDLARAIRSSARQSSEGYDNWLRQYADDSQLMEAATTGRNFVQAAPDPISERGTDAFVRNAANATPPELAVQRAAARQAMEAAGAGPTGARSVLEGFASNQDQARRAAAIGADPARLQARADAELRMVQNAQNVSPRVGSQTGTNMADQAAEVAGTARDVMTGNLPGVVTRVGRRLMSRGFNDQQAEAIGLAALDPARTREVIDLLATRMNRQEARSLLRAIRFSAAQQSGEYAGDEE